jgi:ABC-type amino acid transport substrate-binding protein
MGLPPMGHAVRQDGQGFVPAILRRIFESAGYAFSFVPLPYTRAVAGLVTGEVDCTLDLGRRRAGVLYGGPFLAMFDLSVARLRTTPWQGVQSLKDTRVAFQHGFDLQDFLPVPVVPLPVFDLASSFHMLDLGLASYALDDASLLREAMYDSGLGGQEFVIDPIKSLEARPIFADTPVGRALRTTYDTGMRELAESGELETLLLGGGVSEAETALVLGQAAISGARPQ